MAYRFAEDFSIPDERGRAYGIDIEKNTALSNAHACVTEDGRYHVTLNGNKHFLNTPGLRDFRLEMEFSMRIHNPEFGCGFILYFRYDRRRGLGHSLACAWDREGRRRILLDGRCVDREAGGGIPAFDAEKVRLELQGDRLVFDYNSRRYALDGVDAGGLPRQGEVGFDLLFSPGGSMKVSSVRLEADRVEEAQRPVRSFDFILKKVQGFSEPLKYTVRLTPYEGGAAAVEIALDGTIRGRGKRLESGGGEWCYEIDKLTDPYLRIESGGREFRHIRLARGLLILMDPAEGRLCRKLFPTIEWPLRRTLFLRAFPETFTLAAGYGHACHDPWRMAENGPYEMIRDQDGRLLYEGDAVRRGAAALACRSPADKRLVGRIPRGIPDYDLAVAHAREQHYFFESEAVEFDVELTYRPAHHEPGEFAVSVSFGDPFGRPLKAGAGEFEMAETAAAGPADWLGRRAWRVRLRANPGCGVYHLNVSVRDGIRTLADTGTVFEVLSDDPEGPCPPLASKLPFMLAMPNEIKYLEDDPFNPYGDFGGAGHYFCAVNRYPVVARKLKLWELLRVYRRRWFLMLRDRNTGNPSLDDPGNRELIEHADFIDCHDGVHIGRYDLFLHTWYKGYILEVLIAFVKARRPPLKVITLEALEALYARSPAVSSHNLFSDRNSLTQEQFNDLFDTCWDEWTAYFRERVQVDTQRVADRLLAMNPRIAPGSYGPYSLYVSHYKSPYTLKYAGCDVERDPRIRANGGFYFLEEYHYSCDYPLTRAAYFVAGYTLHFPDGRRLFPEIYYDLWDGCNDGAVYQAHPPYGFYSLSDLHQRRIVYQFAYGSPQFKNGRYQYWEDYGFHVRGPNKNTLKEFLHAWGNLVDNRPARQHKAPFLMLDLEQIGRHGDYREDQYSHKVGDVIEWTDVCNTAEEALGYTYEALCHAGYNTPVLSTLDELDALTPDLAEFVVLPPIVKGTPRRHLDAIRRAHERGIALLCFESACGLEDLFGVRERPDGSVKIVDVEGEVFEHKLALARYERRAGEVRLSGAVTAGGARSIPLVISHATRRGRTLFVNIPPTVIRRESYRAKLGWGQDCLSAALREAMGRGFADLCASPAVRAERGTINAAYTARGDLIVVLGDDSPIYGDATAYPASVRFDVRAPGLGHAAIESDAPYAVISRTADSVRIRTETEKDSAVFFKFSPASGA